jgi:hypothetical protein
MSQNPQSTQNTASQNSQNSQSTQNSQGNSQTSGGSSTTRLTIPQTAAAGGLTITQPPQTATSFFKVAPSQIITFAWNFTSLYSQPAHLTCTAGCDNGNSYPIGPTDGIIDGTATELVWDPYGWNQANPTLQLPLQGTCTLSIWDDRGPTAARAPGLFEKNTALKFALYKPQDYTPIASGWQCIGCNSGALANFTAHPAFAGLIITITIMLLSGYGLLRRH